MLGTLYRAGLLIFGTVYCGLFTFEPLKRVVYDHDWDQIWPSLYGVVATTISYFMYFRSRKRLKEYKQRHKIANEDSSFVEQKDSDDDVNYSQPSKQTGFKPEGGGF
ncbi:hypothetical protein ABEX78_20550 [Priestia megaterium]